MSTMNDTSTARREAAVQTTLQPGSIAVSTWGYDQTNVDFYLTLERKVRKDGSTWVKVRKIHAAQTPSELFMQYTAVPFTHAVTGGYSFAGEPMWRKVSPAGNGKEGFSPTSYTWARSWTGEPVWGSSYA